MSNYKPCPHCGSASIRMMHKDMGLIGENDIGTKKIKYKSYAMCNKCHAKGSPSIFDYLQGCEEGEKALKANDLKAMDNWNLRAEPCDKKPE